jgi:hypothetical protein
MSWAKLARHITTFFKIGGKKEAIGLEIDRRAPRAAAARRTRDPVVIA